jgi:hypothetical protein
MSTEKNEHPINVIFLTKSFVNENCYDYFRLQTKNSDIF